MEITKTCPFCGAVHTLDVDVEPRAIEEWVKGKLIQEAMPHLTDDEREHIKTGICINCWAHDPDEEGDANYPDGSQEQYDSWDDEGGQ